MRGRAGLFSSLPFSPVPRGRASHTASRAPASFAGWERKKGRLCSLWVIKIKSLWSFAHVVCQDHVNRVRNADHAARTCEKFVYLTVKIIRFSDYQTWPTHLCALSAQRCVGSFPLGCAFRKLIGKLLSRGHSEPISFSCDSISEFHNHAQIARARNQSEA